MEVTVMHTTQQKPLMHATQQKSLMHAKRKSADEQYELIMECRNSGLSDYQWCQEHDIKPGTFYNWVKRLRRKACYDIPPATGRGSYKASAKQEVVKLEVIDSYDSIKSVPACNEDTFIIADNPTSQTTIEISLGAAVIKISNAVDPVLLAQVLKSVGGASC
jgi:transposase-like protein